MVDYGLRTRVTRGEGRRVLMAAASAAAASLLLVVVVGLVLPRLAFGYEAKQAVAFVKSTLSAQALEPAAR